MFTGAFDIRGAVAYNGAVAETCSAFRSAGAERCIAVFEPRPRWTAELQRQFDEEVQVRLCPRAQDVAQCLARNRAAVVVLELDAAPDACLQLLGGWEAQTPRPCVIVLASQAVADLEWAVRELGATSFVHTPVSGEKLARLCRRQWGDASG